MILILFIIIIIDTICLLCIFKIMLKFYSLVQIYKLNGGELQKLLNGGSIKGGAN